MSTLSLMTEGAVVTPPLPSLAMPSRTQPLPAYPNQTRPCRARVFINPPKPACASQEG